MHLSQSSSILFFIFFVSSSMIRNASESWYSSTKFTPRSQQWPIFGSIGMLAKSSMSACLARVSPPPDENMLVHSYKKIFSLKSEHYE